MAAEETNPWSAAKRVEALMSSPQTPVKELTYPTVSQDLIDQADAREKEKYEELKHHMMEFFQRGKIEIQQDRENWLATREERHARERVQEAGGGHKGSQSSGWSYQTASPEPKNIEQCFPVGPSQGVPPQGQHLLDQPVPGIQHHHDQDLQIRREIRWNVPVRLEFHDPAFHFLAAGPLFVLPAFWILQKGVQRHLISDFYLCL